MRCVSFLVLLSLSAADTTAQQKQRSCGSGSSKWCSASLLQTPKQGAGVREDAVQDQLRGDFSETIDQLKFHELELEQMMGVEHPEAPAPAAEPKARLTTAAATPRKSSRPSSGLLMSGEHESPPVSGDIEHTLSAATGDIEHKLSAAFKGSSSAFTWTCGPTIFAPKACGYFSGYVGIPVFGIVGVLAVLIVLELVMSSFTDADEPGGGTKAAEKEARRQRLASGTGGNLSSAWQIRAIFLCIVVVPIELYVFYETGMLEAAWQSVAPYLVLLVVLGTCFFPACVSLGTCLKDVFEAIHDRLDELFAVMDEVVHGAERAWEAFEEDVGMVHDDSAAAAAKASVAGTATSSLEGNKLTGKKKKAACC